MENDAQQRSELSGRQILAGGQSPGEGSFFIFFFYVGGLEKARKGTTLGVKGWGG